MGTLWTAQFFSQSDCNGASYTLRIPWYGNIFHLPFPLAGMMPMCVPYSHDRQWRAASIQSHTHAHALLSFPYPIGLKEQMAVKSHSHVTARSTRRRRKPCQCARRNQSLCSNPRRQHRALLGTGENWVTKHFLVSPGFVNVPLSSFKRPYSIFMNRRHLLVSLRQCGWKDWGGATGKFWGEGVKPHPFLQSGRGLRVYSQNQTLFSEKCL